MKVAVVNGPNLNLLGGREPEIYGGSSLEEIEAGLKALGEELGIEVLAFQSNHEGELIDHIQGLREEFDGLIVNPGGLTHTSVALRDALALTNLPFVEVHLSNIFRREPFRQHSYLADLALGVVAGFGPQGYFWALSALADHLGKASTRG